MEGFNTLTLGAVLADKQKREADANRERAARRRAEAAEMRHASARDALEQFAKHWGLSMVSQMLAEICENNATSLGQGFESFAHDQAFAANRFRSVQGMLHQRGL